MFIGDNEGRLQAAIEWEAEWREAWWAVTINYEL
jgi:hypothetical protein